MSYTDSVKKDVLRIAVLMATALLIFYPVFYTEYAYTDELVGLWQWRFNIQDSSGTLLQYGRYITGKLAELLFGSVSSIKELTWIRLFSLGGWLLCIPVWYFVLKKIIQKEKIPEILAFFSVLYLICTPSVAISIGWAACFELFLANTLGLLSGYFLYAGVRFEDNRLKVSAGYLIASVIAGITCLFTYQNCFGCFLLPFFLSLISTSKLSKKIYIGIAAYFLIYGIYYVLFKYSLKVNHIEETARTGLHINVGNKLSFFLLRPLNSAFHFAAIFNENSLAGIVVYLLIAGTWLVISFIKNKELKVADRIKYFVFVFCGLGLVYLPSLVVQENYASNRTMFALSMAVFLGVATTFLRIIKTRKTKYIIVGAVSFLWVINAWYNFNMQFLYPVSEEYKAVKKFIEKDYNEKTDTVYFVRPPEDFFVRRYGVTRSWDEFGVPSTFFGWTPEFLVKQLILEHTGKKEAADKLTIKSCSNNEECMKAADTSVLKKNIYVNIEEVLKEP